MINNNPYNIPEKLNPSQAQALRQSMPINHLPVRKKQQMPPKSQSLMLKKSSLPFIISTSLPEHHSTSLQFHTSVNSQMLQASTVTKYKGFPEQSEQTKLINSQLSSEQNKLVNSQLTAIQQRLQSHQRKLMILMEVRKHQSNTCYSQSLTFSNGEGFASKQMDRPSSITSFGSGVLQKIQQQVVSFKNSQTNMQKSLKASLQMQRQSLTEQIITSFKESLQQKFNQEQAKIAECFLQFEKQSVKKLQEMADSLRKQFKVECKNIKLNLFQQNNSIRDKFQVDNTLIGQRSLELETRITQMQKKHQKFRQLVFNKYMVTQKDSINAAQIAEQLATIQSNIATIQSTLAQPSPPYAYKHSHVSLQKSQSQVYEVSYQEKWQCELTQKTHVRSYDRRYYIDKEGNLLDHEHFYLLDAKNQQIKLRQSQIDKLRNQGMFD